MWPVPPGAARLWGELAGENLGEPAWPWCLEMLGLVAADVAYWSADVARAAPSASTNELKNAMDLLPAILDEEVRRLKVKQRENAESGKARTKKGAE